MNWIKYEKGWIPPKTDIEDEHYLIRSTIHIAKLKDGSVYSMRTFDHGFYDFETNCWLTYDAQTINPDTITHMCKIGDPDES